MKEEKMGIIKEKFTLTGLTKYCNEAFGTKKNGTKFTLSDMKGYVSRGFLPKSIGGFLIVTLTKDQLNGLNSTVPLYQLENMLNK